MHFLADQSILFLQMLGVVLLTAVEGLVALARELCFLITDLALARLASCACHCCFFFLRHMKGLLNWVCHHLFARGRGGFFRVEADG